MATFGFKPSELDGTEYVFSVAANVASVPSRYSYKRFLPKVIDQGQDPICVPCSASAYLNWKENLKTGSKKDNKVALYELYNSKNSQEEGMTFKEAFSYLRHHGVSSKVGNMKIGHYAMVRSFLMLRNAIVANGPCFAALPVYNFNSEFWNKMPGDSLQGYHAVSIVGYDKDGFIIRNSWGTSFADKGYTHISNEDVSKMLEVWTIID